MSSKLVEIGRAAQRQALLAELEARGWNLTRAANSLGLGGSANALRLIRSLGLTAEYERARSKGLVRVGGRRKSERGAKP